MKNLVKIEKKTDKAEIDLDAVSGLLSKYNPESIELFFNENLVDVIYPKEDKKWQKDSL